MALNKEKRAKMPSFSSFCWFIHRTVFFLKFFSKSTCTVLIPPYNAASLTRQTPQGFSGCH
ncbi:hypothetical protein, partial [Vibrio fluvialis]|uniref:hypothetical protein n=1 Tax=Vibrio fluvialis TaxID=676 RepID=UPI0028F70613